MYRDNKFIRRGVIQACGEGDLDKLKEFQSAGNIDQFLIKEALFYTVRACHIECVDFLLSTGRISLDELNKRGIVWSIVNKRGTKQENRIKMFRYLHDNGLEGIPYTVLNKYLQLSRKYYFTMALNEFSSDIDLDKLLEDNSHYSANDRRHEFLAEIRQELRNKKLDSLI